MEEERASTASRNFRNEIKAYTNKEYYTFACRCFYVFLTLTCQKRQIEKRKSAATDAGEIDQYELRALERPQRYSTTSGFGQASSNKKTWSIPTAEDQEASNNSKKRKRSVKPKDQGTGVNAIPVY